MVPTITDTTLGFKKAKDLGRILYQLSSSSAVLKKSLYIITQHRSPSFYYRGGQITTLCKGSGSTHDSENYRDIAVADDDSKLFGSHT